MSHFEFQADLPDEGHPDWQRLKQEAEPAKTVLQLIPGLPGSMLIPVVLVLAAAQSVDIYKTDLAILLQQNPMNIVDANLTVRSSQIVDAVRQAAGLKQLRSQGATITGIVFKKVGPNTVVRVLPPSPSLSLYSTVDGTDKFHRTWSLVTDTAGEISFNIPAPGQRPVLDRIVISTTAPGDPAAAGLVAITSTATFVW